MLGPLRQGAVSLFCSQYLPKTSRQTTNSSFSNSIKHVSISRKRENRSSSKIGEGIHLLPVFKMITREKLAEQLKVYQSRSHHKWNSTLVIFSPKPQLYTRTDITVARVLAFLFSVLVIFAFLAFYFRHFWLSLILICFGILLPVCLKISRRRKLAMKRERRMLLPLSM